MSDNGNKLKKVAVNLRFETTSGYISTQTIKAAGNAAALSTVDELTRILAIDGSGNEAIATANAAFRRVVDYNAEKEGKVVPADFAKIIRASNGQQVIAFKGTQDEDESNALCFMADFGGATATAKFGGIPDDKFEVVLDKLDVAMVDKFIAETSAFFVQEG